MKKVLSLLIAVVLVCSMATVALAGAEKSCDICGFVTESALAFNNHMLDGTCGRCGYCGNGFENAAELEEHKPLCTKANIGCDYCGDTFASENKFNDHLANCKAKYFNIPLAKIIATVKNLISKIDFEKVLGTVKDLGGKAVGAISGLIK